MNKTNKLRVTQDDFSATGYSIYSGTERKCPASQFEIKMWRMYVAALDLALRLHHELDELLLVEVKNAVKSKK